MSSNGLQLSEEKEIVISLLYELVLNYIRFRG